MHRPLDRVLRSSRLLKSLAIAAAAFAGCAAAPPAAADAPDPVALLSASADSLYEANAAAIDLTASVRVVQGGGENETRSAYRFARRGAAKFSFEPVFGEGDDTNDGVLVRGDGELILTRVIAMGRYTLEESSAGFASFVQSPLSQGVGSPLGGLGLSLLHPETTAEMVRRVTSSEYVGAEPLGETPTHRCRYVVDDRIEFDVWYTTGETPAAVQLEADLGELMASGDPGAAGIEYVVTFGYTPSAGAAPTDADFALSEPPGSIHVESFFQRRDDAPHRLLGQAAPPFELTDLEGRPVTLANHLGKDVVVLDFWATWCPPCVAALPKIDSITRSFAEQGVVFYAVDQSETVETVNAFLEARELSPPVLMDVEGAASAAYDVEGLPTSVLIGKDGTVQVVHVGLSPNLETQLTEELQALVNGADLATAKVAAHREKLEKRREKLQQLRAKLNGSS